MKCDNCKNKAKGFVEVKNSKWGYFKVMLCRKCLKLVADKEISDEDLYLISWYAKRKVK